MLLSGCCMNNLETATLTISPIKEARFLYSENRQQEAISVLKNALKTGGHRCEAAFYLIFLDADKKEYRNILEEQTCTSRYPFDSKIIHAFAKAKEKYKKCRQVVRSLKKQKKRCLSEKVKLQKEKDKLSFELKKLEQIRMETERLRLKK